MNRGMGGSWCRYFESDTGSLGFRSSTQRRASCFPGRRITLRPQRGTFFDLLVLALALGDARILDQLRAYLADGSDKLADGDNLV